MKQGQKKYRNYDREYVDLPQFPTVRRFVCENQKVIYINVAANEYGGSIRVKDFVEELPVL